MGKQPVRVIIGREVQLTSPGMLGRIFEFQAGHSFLTQEWFYPGELYEKGAQAGKPRDQWSFETNSGTDLPLFIRIEDVREVVIPMDPEMIKVFEKAPFNVTIQDRQP
ncbi:MAG TPA: hypothetical protein VN452_05725 [Longilinea sp.]|nr:hypothetical protein [Longilinea sp.]